MNRIVREPLGVAGADVVFIVTPPWQTTRYGGAGDYMDVALFRSRFPDLVARTVRFNDPSTDVEIAGGRALLHQDECGTIDLARVATFVYFPYSFEPEDVALRPPDRSLPDHHWEHRQWRAIGAWLEDSLPRFGRCLNDPAKARAASNKLIQLSAFRHPLVVPPTWVGNTKAGSFLDGRRTVVKNLSEGTYTGELLGLGRILLARPAAEGDGAHRSAPVILQQRVDAPVELRTYVIGERVLTLESSRARTTEDAPDVRQHGLRPEDVRLTDDWRRFDADLVACARRLGLGYAVFDLMPEGDLLHVLEVNPNGVWTGTWAEVGRPIRDALHEHVAAMARETRASARV